MLWYLSLTKIANDYTFCRKLCGCSERSRHNQICVVALIIVGVYCSIVQYCDEKWNISFHRLFGSDFRLYFRLHIVCSSNYNLVFGCAIQRKWLFRCVDQQFRSHQIISNDADTLFCYAPWNAIWEYEPTITERSLPINVAAHLWFSVSSAQLAWSTTNNPTKILARKEANSSPVARISWFSHYIWYGWLNETESNGSNVTVSNCDKFK